MTNKRIRVLLINHTYMIAAYRKVLDLLAQEVDLHVLVPATYPKGTHGATHCEPSQSTPGYTLYTSDVALSRFRGPLYKDLPAIVNKIRPHVVHMAYEVGSLVGVQVLSLSLRYGFKIVSSVVENIYYCLASEGWRRMRSSQLLYGLGFLGMHLWEKLFLNRLSAILACSSEAESIFRDRGFRGPISWYPIGIDTDQFRKLDVTALRSQLGLDGFTIGYYGRLTRPKGVHILFEASAMVSEPHKLLIDRFITNDADRAYAAQLEDLSKRLGIADRVVYFDAKHSEMPKYLNCADCVVVPSLTTPTWKEQYGRIIAEAIACEKPVIGSTSGNIPGLVGTAGVVVQEGDRRALAKQLRKVMADGDFQVHLGNVGRRRSVDHLSVMAESRIYASTYKQITGLA